MVAKLLAEVSIILPERSSSYWLALIVVPPVFIRTFPSTLVIYGGVPLYMSARNVVSH